MTVEINGVSIHYETAGDTGSRVLLLHGWGCSLAMMKPVADELKKTHRILMIDFPGHGESGRPPEPWGVPEYAGCLNSLIRTLGFYPCAVIAHSFGCRVAAWTAVHEPELFGRLILTGAAGIKPIPTEEARKRGEKYRKYKNICESMKKIPVLKKTAEQCEDRLRLKYGSRDYNALDREMQKTFSRIVSQDLKDLYPEIRQSTLLIWGENDTETPLWMGKEMEKRIPDAGLVIFEGGSHFAYLEQIGRFNLIAGQFLKEDM